MAARVIGRDDVNPEGEFRERMSIVTLLLLGAALFGLFLPGITLDSALADAVVVITDTASRTVMPLLSVATLAMVVTRPHVTPRRRSVEAAVAGLTVLVVLVGSSQLNENFLKPLFAIPRPNIEALAESGALGDGAPDVEAFYAKGDTEERRDLLEARLAAPGAPHLSETVRAHWANAAGFAFPSGHSMTAAAFATTVAALGIVWLGGWRRRLAVVALPVWAVAVGYSRILLEVHSAGDVAAGTLIGIGWGLVTYWVITRTVEYLSARIERSASS